MWLTFKLLATFTLSLRVDNFQKRDNSGNPILCYAGFLLFTRAKTKFRFGRKQDCGKLPRMPKEFSITALLHFYFYLSIGDAFKVLRLFHECFITLDQNSIDTIELQMVQDKMLYSHGLCNYSLCCNTPRNHGQQRKTLEC